MKTKCQTNLNNRRKLYRAQQWRQLVGRATEFEGIWIAGTSDASERASPFDRVEHKEELILNDEARLGRARPRRRTTIYLFSRQAFVRQESHLRPH